jgi:diaminohydroxyphosphoribosylaminopyrimidine deaminase/5-amino-6-(5-phosphoribosylamino)uracil reductase
MSSADETFMRSALRLARRGIGSVEPNPAVGCVIVRAGRIVGRGWHKKFGGPHAEINALEDCRMLGGSTEGATMYVTLEPCCHYAKTPPCTEAIISAGLSKVVVAAIDPSEHANGKGIEQLRNASIQVQTGVCETEAKLLNAPFIKFAVTGRCWVILKWAQSIDGKVAYAKEIVDSRPRSNQPWISNELSRKDVQRLRRRVQAILVGVNTVIADDPLLTVRLRLPAPRRARPSKGKQPIRIVLDSRLRTPPQCRLVQTAKKSPARRGGPVLICAAQSSIEANPRIAGQLTDEGAELLACPTRGNQCDLHFLLGELSRRGVSQLLVEGGPTVLTSFLRERLADEICVYIAPKIIGPQGSVDITQPMAEVIEPINLQCVDIKRFGDDVRLTGLTKEAVAEISVQH